MVRATVRLGMATHSSCREHEPFPGHPERPDTLVLGCTHYPVLRPVLQELMGPETRLIDSAQATAQAVAPWLRAAPVDQRE